MVAALFACYRLGAIAVPVNARLTGAEIARIRDHAAPAAMLFTTRVSPDAARHAAEHGADSLDGELAGLVFAARGTDDPEPGAGDVAAMLFTTGTTGTPKGVMLTHANLAFAARASVDRRRITQDDLIYGVLPISHVFGLASILTASVRAGAALWLEPRFSADRLYAALNQGVTLFSGVPQMHALLMQFTRERGHDRLPGGTLRYVTSGGAPLDPAWKRKAEAFYGHALQNGYGLTETTAGVTVTTNRLGDEDILAFVMVAEGDAPDEAELRAFVAERLAGYKRPARYVFATSLPAAPTGKILKHRLLEVFADRLR